MIALEDGGVDVAGNCVVSLGREAIVTLGPVKAEGKPGHHHLGRQFPSGIDDGKQVVESLVSEVGLLSVRVVRK